MTPHDPICVVFLQTTPSERRLVCSVLLDESALPISVELDGLASGSQSPTVLGLSLEVGSYVLAVVGSGGDAGAGPGGLDPSVQALREALQNPAAADKPVVVVARSGLDRASIPRLVEGRSVGLLLRYHDLASLAEATGTAVDKVRLQAPASPWVSASSTHAGTARQPAPAVLVRLGRPPGGQIVTPAGQIDPKLLAQGADEVRFVAMVTGTASASAAEGTATSTWAAIFGCVAPCLVDEAPQRDLDARVTAHVKSVIRAALGLAAVAPVRLDSELLETVLMQFVALGWIEPSESKRRRPVNDTNIYWSLTRLGLEEAKRLRACWRPAV